MIASPSLHVPELVAVLFAAALAGASSIAAQDALSVARVSPAGELRPSSRIDISFSAPIAGRIEGLRDPASMVRLDPAIAATIIWRDPATIRITPDSALPPGAEITVSVDTLTAANGARLATRWSRTWRVRPPTIVATLPSLSATAVSQLGYEGRIFLLVRGAPDTAALAARTAFVAPPVGARCVTWPADRRIGVRVEVRKPREEDPYPLRQYAPPGATADARFDHIVVITPAEPIPEGCMADLVLGALTTADGLPETRYRVRSAASASLSVECRPLGDCVAARELIVRSAAPVTWQMLRATVRLEPADAFTWPDSAAASHTWSFRHRLASGDTVRLIVAAGFRDVHGRTVPTPKPFVIPDRIPAWHAQGGLAVTTSESASPLQVRHVGIDSVRVTLYRGPRDALALLRNPSGFADDTNVVWQDSVKYTLPLASSRNDERLTAVPLRLPTAQWQSGLLGVRAEAAGYERFRARALPLMLVVQHSDLVAHTRVHASGGAVFVTDARGERVQGAQLRALDARGRLVARARTDRDGLAQLEAAPLADDANQGTWPFAEIVAVEVSHGRDRLLASLTSGSPFQYRFGRVGREWDAPTEPRYQHGVVLTDRDLFRPGERVHATAIVRDGWSDALRPVSGERVRWRLLAVSPFGGEGAVIATSERPLSAAGLATDSFPLPPDAALGSYDVVLERRHADAWHRITSRSVEVSEYRPQELRLSGSFDRAAVSRGDTLHATISARLLLDAPLGDAEVEWYAQYEDNDDGDGGGLPPGWSAGDQFSYGDRTRQTIQRAGKSRTGANGDVRMTLATDSMPFNSGAHITLVATVRDLTGQVVTAQATATVRGSSRRIVFRRPSGWSQPLGRTDTLRFGVVDRDGRWVDGLPVRVSVIRRRRVTRSEEGLDVTRMVQDTLERARFVSRDSSGTFVYTPTSIGELGIVIESEDENGESIRGSIHRYIIRGEPPADSAAFPMTLSADSAQVDEEVTVRFNSPWPDAEAWVVVARDRVFQQSRVRVSAGINRVRLRVDRRWIPRATVSVMLVRRGARPGPAAVFERYRVQQVEISVGAESKRLSVAVTPVSREVEPGTATSIDIQVRDARGRPVEGEAMVWAVDEGVLALTGYEVPDPLKQLLTQRRWTDAALRTTLTASPGNVEVNYYGVAGGIAMRSSMALSAAVVTSERSAYGLNQVLDSPSSISSPDIRSQFRTTAFYRSAIRVGADGRARVRVSVPDGITTHRVMAIAVDRSDRSGTGVSSVIATKPLIARAALPRFVRAADTFSAGVAISARGQPLPLTVTASARATGAVALKDSTPQRVRVDSTGTRVSFDAAVSRGNAGQFVFTVTSDSLRDAVAVELPVREDHSPEARVLVALVSDSAALRLSLPPDIDPTRSRVSIRVGASPLPVLRAWNTWLDGERSDFTYAVVFTARGLIAMLRLHAHDAIAVADSTVLRRRLDVAVATLVSRIRPDGSVRMWPSALLTERAFDAEVGRTLLEARALGASVPEYSIRMIQGAVQRSLAATPLLPETTYGSAAQRRQLVLRHLEDRLAAAALDTLTASHLTPLVAVAGRMSFEGRARLAGLLTPGADAQRLLAELWSHARVRGTRVDITDSVLARGTRRSRIAPFARLLEATQRHQPDHPMIGPLAQRIIQQVSAGGASMWNGEDYASAIEAIAGFMRSVAATDATVVLRDPAGRAILISEPGGKSVDVERSMDSLVVSTDRGMELPLQVRAQGGPAYVSITAQVLRRERPVAAADNGLAVERWYERVRDGAIVTEVADGELVRVHLRLSVDGAREFVVMEDLLPAGVEVVDPHHRGTGSEQAWMLQERRARESESDDSVRDGSFGWNGWWRWNPWDHVERRDDRLVIYSRGMPAGVHEYTYVVRATTAGRFVRPQATAREYFNPGLGGSSEGGWFVVAPRSQR